MVNQKFWKNRKVLVTGHTGFKGSWLSLWLQHLGATVVGVSLEPPTKPNIYKQAKVSDGMISLRLDIRDGDKLKNLFQEQQPDIVFHLASLYISQHKSEEVDCLIKSNLLFGTQLLEAMRNNNVTKMINTGTSWQHYQNREYSPVNLYAATKQAFEMIIQSYVESEQLQIITLKLFDTYGPGDPRKKLIYLLKHVSETGENLVMSPGEQLIDLVHIDDVTDAYCIAAKYIIDNFDEPGHERYMISSGRTISLKSLRKLVECLIDKKINVLWGGRPYRPREVMEPIKESNCLPGWTPKITLEEGLLGVMNNYK